MKWGIVMEYRVLGKTGLRVSSIGMGGIPLQRVSEEEAERIVNVALDQGINFFDSARGYTDSEAKFGLVFRHRRQEAIIATKSMERTREGILQEVKDSLKALQVDYIDLYQLHNVKSLAILEQVLGPEGALRGLQEAKAQGKIRHIGITGHVAEVLEKAITLGEFETVQFPFNAVELGPTEKIIPLAQAHDVGMIVMKPVAGGAIPDKNLALRFLMDYPVASIIPGMDSEEQVLENAAIGRHFVPLNEEESKRLQESIVDLGTTFCRRCEYCMPCPQGINIPVVFLLDGYWQRYGLQDWAQERYLAMEVQADECIECGTCTSRCPYGLEIPRLIAQVHRRLGRN
jgi:predicted aldo/keto reductase-like oxidoreductase